jgi:sucrose phosphorylase
MSIKNEIILITYANSMGENLKELTEVLKKNFKGIFGGVHILPFFPSSADRGFAPITYEEVDSNFGNWEDINSLKEDFNLMFDFMVNHISRQSKYFKDFAENKDNSKYSDFFIRYKDFWPNGEPTRHDLNLVYKRKDRDPCIDIEFKDGTKECVWCTFDSEQVDINISSETASKFIEETLVGMVKRGAKLIRLDAFAYTTKKVGTNCFFVEPNIWKILDNIKKILEPYSVEILPEIHEHYKIQLSIAEKGYWVYDFALPMIMLYTIYSCSNKRLIEWLHKCPRKQFTTLDTHDGIGVVDVIDLLTDKEIEETKEYMFSKGANVKKSYNSSAYNNLDCYQINCTYYSALGNNDDAYILSRAIQFFTPGIPQVYYVGALAGENDIKLIEKTKQGRDINRHNYTIQEINENLERPVVKRLMNLMRFRNSYNAFDGEFIIGETNNEHELNLIWKNEKSEASLSVNLKTCDFEINYFDHNLKLFRKLENVSTNSI